MLNQDPTPIPNEHIARSVARKLLNIEGSDGDPRFRHAFYTHITPSHWLRRHFYGEKIHREESYKINLIAKNMATLENSFKDWAVVERLEGDNCYHHETAGEIAADVFVRLGELPDTLAISINRADYDYELNKFYVVTDALKIPTTLDRTSLWNVLETPSHVKFQLLACVFGTYEVGDEKIIWHGYMRVPGTQDWRQVNSNVECFQYTQQELIPTERVMRFLNGDVKGHFPLMAWYQQEDVNVELSTPSVSVWEQGWRQDVEYSIESDTGASFTQAAVGIPVATVI